MYYSWENGKLITLGDKRYPPDNPSDQPVLRLGGPNGILIIDEIPDGCFLKREGDRIVGGTPSGQLNLGTIDGGLI